MNDESHDVAITRRQALAGSAALLAGLAVNTYAPTSAQAAEPIRAQAAEPIRAQAPWPGQVTQWVTREELEVWTRAFADGLEKGTSLVATLEAAADLTPNEHLSRASENLLAIVKMGYTLSGAMALSPHLFDRNYLVTVQFGELYGELDVALKKWLAAKPAVKA